MGTEREFEGRDLEEAKAVASKAMGIAEPDLDFRIVEQGRRGLFGLGAKSVRIRVMPPVVQPPDPRLPAPLEPEPSGEGDEERPGAELPAEASRVEQTVNRMLELMGLEIEASAHPLEGGVELRLRGRDQKLLTQKDAELLSALQFLLNRMARRAWPGVGRIHLSCDGQRRRRDSDLVELTREVARQVGRTGRTKRLQPMNAYERRLVHLTVREFGELGSRSEGNGHLKRVRIFKQG